jgi:hypothetical protein
MDAWKKSFAERLGHVRSGWAAQLDQALEEHAVPVFNDLAEFLRDNGVVGSMPLREKGRRSFKFELAEDAYVLLIFRSTAVGEFELSREVFILGAEPKVRKTTERLANLNQDWARQEFQAALDSFIGLLEPASAPAEAEVVGV